LQNARTTRGVFLPFEKFINFNKLAMNTGLSLFFRFHNTSFDLTILQKSAGMAGIENKENSNIYLKYLDKLSSFFKKNCQTKNPLPLTLDQLALVYSYLDHRHSSPFHNHTILLCI
jgi:hypothetical protein